MSKKDPLTIEHATKKDADELNDMIDNISDKESEYLALDKKIKHIRQLVKDGNHIIVARMNGKLAGFIRSSDRHNNTIMIEEVYVHPKYRGNGIATALIKYACVGYDSAEAKSFASNKAIVATLSHLDFERKYSPKKTMIMWKKELKEDK